MRPLTFVLGWLVASVALAPCRAQTPAEFYKGKTIDVFIGTSVGGGYDAYARMLSRHMGRYIPAIRRWCEEQRSSGCARQFLGTAPKDGSQLHLQPRLVCPLGSKNAVQAAGYDRRTNNESIASPGTTIAGIKSADAGTDRRRKRPAADTYVPKIANGACTRFKITLGFRAQRHRPAMERGGAGRCAGGPA